MSRPRSIAWHRAQALADIDAAAGDARCRYITDVPGQQAVYLSKHAEAMAYLQAISTDAGTAEPGPHIAAEAAALGVTPLDVAQTVAALAAQWVGVLSPAIEAARLGGKAAVAAAAGDGDGATLAAIAGAREAAIAALGAI